MLSFVFIEGLIIFFSYDPFCVFYSLACSKEYFGTNCSQVCSPNCKPETCRPTDGSCICAAGLTADDCTIGNFFIFFLGGGGTYIVL